MSLLLSTLRRSAQHTCLCASRKRLYTSSIAGTSKTPSTVASNRRLPNEPARTRFAPSPTGYLHLGSLRTALFNYLLAKSTGGQFILRIEDTDQKRTIPDAEKRLYQDLEWAGLQWDEGPNIGGPYGPYKQSQRTSLYREHADKLLDSGNAYRCFCTMERLQSLAKMRSELGLPIEYDRACAHISVDQSNERASQGEAHVIRLKSPARYPDFRDLVYGWVKSRKDKAKKIQIEPSFEDPILIKSDGFPTYHLANVVDDHHMKITHVVRGAEWMSSTPKHLAMYEAFGWQPPNFAHVGLLLDKQRQKLSKRNMDTDVASFRDKMGVFPETLTNYVALLGWSHGKKSDVMNMKELIENFSMKFTTGDTVVSLEKMWYLQKSYAERYSSEEDGSNLPLILDPLSATIKDLGLTESLEAILRNRDQTEYLSKLVRADAKNYTNYSAFVERNKFFFSTPDEDALMKTRDALLHMTHHHGLPATIQLNIDCEDLVKAIEFLSYISESDWEPTTLSTCIQSIITTKAEETLDTIDFGDLELDVQKTTKQIELSWAKQIHRYLRWAVVNGLPGPNGASTLDILGRTETLERLNRAAIVMDREKKLET